jgi:hypothetical protein
MTLEQIISTHPCPIIRGKIMENLTQPKNTETHYSFSKVIIHCLPYWANTKEGRNFWDCIYESVYSNRMTTYAAFQHLDLSYVPEPAKPPVMWRKIDKDNLPVGAVLAKSINNKSEIPIIGIIRPTYSGFYVECINYKPFNREATHYIPLSDLINLPIEP